MIRLFHEKFSEGDLIVTTQRKGKILYVLVKEYTKKMCCGCGKINKNIGGKNKI